MPTKPAAARPSVPPTPSARGRRMASASGGLRRERDLHGRVPRSQRRRQGSQYPLPSAEYACDVAESCDGDEHQVPGDASIRAARAWAPARVFKNVRHCTVGLNGDVSTTTTIIVPAAGVARAIRNRQRGDGPAVGHRLMRRRRGKTYNRRTWTLQWPAAPPVSAPPPPPPSLLSADLDVPHSREDTYGHASRLAPKAITSNEFAGLGAPIGPRAPSAQTRPLLRLNRGDRKPEVGRVLIGPPYGVGDHDQRSVSRRGRLQRTSLALVGLAGRRRLANVTTNPEFRIRLLAIG